MRQLQNPVRALVPLAMLLTACATRPFCQAGDYHFHTDFETANLYACEQGAAGPELTLAPEYAPINPSSWYAWRVTGPATGELLVNQRYRFGEHRYAPWISRNGLEWQALGQDRFSVSEDGSLTMKLEVPSGGLYVAGHPPLGHSAMEDWARDLAARTGLESGLVATSVAGQAISAYVSPTQGRQGALVMLGRQHPPEVTGGLAFQRFAERLLAGDELSRRFQARFAVGLVPGVNPDGVERGYWRTNLRGVDLNRDWGPFTQPETRGVADWLLELNGRLPLTLLIDFHSTWSDIFYMPHPSDDRVPSGFAERWRARLAERLGEEMPGWSGQHNPGLPTAKTWARQTFGILAMTYEVGDDTPPDRIRRVANAAAEEMMRLLLGDEEHES